MLPNNVKTILQHTWIKGDCVLDPKSLALSIVKMLADKKAIDTETLEISALTTVADYFVICSGSSASQVKALNVIEKCGVELGTEPLRTEGYKTCSWILIDFGSVVVHIFRDEARDFYALDRLWGDAERLPAE